MKIENGSLVELHYRLLDAEGELVESTEADEPIRYRHGAEEILPGLERGLEGAAAGEHRRVEVEASEAYGEYDPEGLVLVPLSELPDGMELAPGEWVSVELQDPDAPDADEEDREMELRVVEVQPESVVLDANHPLAGQRVTFEVEVLSVRAG